MLQFYSRQQLKQQLPLEYVLVQLGQPLDQTGRALCPFHQDSNPSLRIYESDYGHQKFHCDPCGADGDVFDLIRKIKGVDFPTSEITADRYLAQLPTDWRPMHPVSASTTAADPAAWGEELRRAQERAAQPVSENGFNGLLAFMTGFATPGETDDHDAKAIDRLLREYLGWGVIDEGARNVILIPHWSEDGILTGVKVRDIMGSKYARGGSTFDDLYMSWLPKQYKSLLLCEGETDAIWAYMSILRNGVPNVDVRALPKGAGNITDRHVEQAKQWDHVFLVMDGDRAGVRATRELVDKLGPQALVCTLPLDKDLREVKPDLQRMLAKWVRPDPIPNAIQVQNGVWMTQGQQGPRQLCSWWAEPTAKLVVPDHEADEEKALVPGYEIDVHTTGKPRDDIISVRDMASSQKLVNWAYSRGLNVEMTDGDVKRLMSLFAAQAQIVPSIYQTSRAGVHLPPEEFSWAGRTLVLPNKYIGTLPWMLVGNDRTSQILYDQEAAGRLEWEWLQAVLELNEPRLMQPILAWFAATVRRVEAQNFPLLFIGGASGSGKSTVASLMCQMFGSAIREDLGGATWFPIMHSLSASTTIPIFIDEWSRQSRPTTLEELRGNLPRIYAGGKIPRGRPDQTGIHSVYYPVTAPVVLAGEDTFEMQREVDRIISVGLTRSGQNLDALHRLTSQPLQRFGYAYNYWLVMHARDLPPLPSEATAQRPEYNKQMLRAGWATLQQFMQWRADNGDDRVISLPAEVDLSVLDEAAASYENEYELLVQEAAAFVEPGTGYKIAWPDPDGNGTFIRFKAITADWVTRMVDIRIPGGWRAMQRYFEEKYSVEKTRRAQPISGDVISCHLVRGFYVDRDTPKETS